MNLKLSYDEITTDITTATSNASTAVTSSGEVKVGNATPERLSRNIDRTNPEGVLA